MQDIFDVGLLAAGLRMAVPVLFAALGGLFTDRVNIFNVGLEGMMLVGAFAAVAGSVWTGSSFVGLVTAIAAGLLMATLFAVVVMQLRADPIMTGLAINLLAGGLTVVLMQTVFGARGVFVSSRVALFPQVTPPFVQNLPWINKLLGGNNLLFYGAFLAAPLLHAVFYHTRLGLRVRAVGQYALAAESVGVRPRTYQWISLLMSGLFAGTAGAYLSLSSLGMFSEGMSAGRGFIALAAIFFGRSTPFGILLAALFFGMAESAAIRLQGFGVPSQLVLMVPYVAAVVSLALAAGGWGRRRRTEREQSAA